MRSERLTAIAVLVSVVLGAATCHAGTDPTSYRFDFGPGAVAPGYIQVIPATVYSKQSGYGFDLGSTVLAVDRGGDDPLRGDFCTSDQPFFFSVDLPEGNYNVTVILGDQAGESTTTVKAESRRLMLEKIRTARGEFTTRTFTVNVRNSQLGSRPAGRVKLKTREQGVLHWDDKLTLEFNDTRPCVCALEINKVDDAITVYLVGDSTVTDQPREPWNSWGQMLTRFFKAGRGGGQSRRIGGGAAELRGREPPRKGVEHDQGGRLSVHPVRAQRPERTRRRRRGIYHLQAVAQAFRRRGAKRGAVPVLVTPMNRRTFDAGGKITNSLGDYPDAVRQTAKEEGIPLIDLNAMSKPFYEAFGPEDSKKAFVDNTHHNNYGSYELARCVVEGIKANHLGISPFLVDDLPPFDPAHPDPIDRVDIPASPQRTSVKPEGN